MSGPDGEPGAGTIAVLVADDQELVRTGFAMVVDAARDMRVVATAADGAEAVELVARHRPDVVLMDVRMPRTDGIAATRAIVAAGGPPRVVALTTFDDDASAMAMLAAGACGFLLKDTTAEGLTAAIRTVHSGGSVITPSVTRRLVEQRARPTAAPPVIGPPGVLETFTAREREVFDLVVAGAGNQEIARRLHIAEVTVKTNVGRILAKLSVRDRIGIVIWAYENGVAG